MIVTLTFSILNDLGATGLHDSDARIGSTEINTNDSVAGKIKVRLISLNERVKIYSLLLSLFRAIIEYLRGEGAVVVLHKGALKMVSLALLEEFGQHVLCVRDVIEFLIIECLRACTASN